MKSSVTPFAVSTGRKGPKGAPTFNPSMPATNSAAAVLSRAATIVWFSWTAIACSPAADRDRLPAEGPTHRGRGAKCRDAHSADRSSPAGRGDRPPDRGDGPGVPAAGAGRRRAARPPRGARGRPGRAAAAPGPRGRARVGRRLPAARLPAPRTRPYGPGRVPRRVAGRRRPGTRGPRPARTRRLRPDPAGPVGQRGRSRRPYLLRHAPAGRRPPARRHAAARPRAPLRPVGPPVALPVRAGPQDHGGGALDAPGVRAVRGRARRRPGRTRRSSGRPRARRVPPLRTAVPRGREWAMIDAARTSPVEPWSRCVRVVDLRRRTENPWRPAEPARRPARRSDVRGARDLGRDRLDDGRRRLGTDESLRPQGRGGQVRARVRTPGVRAAQRAVAVRPDAAARRRARRARRLVLLRGHRPRRPAAHT